MSYGNNRSYNQMGYGQGGQGGNRYDQRDEYDPNGYNGGGYGRQGDLEMQNMPLTGQQGGYQDGNAILNACQEIDREIAQLENQLSRLEGTYRRAADNPQESAQQIDSQSASIMSGYRSLVERVRKIKSQPEAKAPRNKPQVERIDRKLKALMHSYQTMESKHRKDMQAQAERQYRIVKPDATEAEVAEATEDPNAQIFQQALMQSDRRGQATTVLNNVRARHEEIKRIERQMVELAELFQQLDTMVMEQDEVIQDIDMKAEETVQTVQQANVEIEGAIVHKRGIMRKKWWCILIVVLIIAVIAAIIAIVVTVLKPKN